MNNTEPSTLADRLREHLGESTETDPELIAKTVLASIPEAEMDGVVMELMTFYVAKNGRSTARVSRMKPSPHFKPSPVAASLSRSNVRVATLLSSRLTVDSQLQIMASMRRSDLLASAEFNRNQAAGNIRAAEQKERLAGLMADGQVVSDLSDDEIEKAWWAA